MHPSECESMHHSLTASLSQTIKIKGYGQTLPKFDALLGQF